MDIALTAVDSLPPFLPTQEENVVNLTAAEFDDLFEQFRTALQDNNFKASEIFTQLKSSLAAQNSQQYVAELANSLEQLNFQNALLILERINSPLKGT